MDQHALALDEDPSLAGELREHPIDVLSRRADQLADLFLPQVVVEPYASVLLYAEPMRQPEQLFGHPSGHIGGHHFRQPRVGASQLAGD